MDAQPDKESYSMEVKPDEIKRASQQLKDMNAGREPTLSELEQYFNENGVSKDKLMPPREQPEFSEAQLNEPLEVDWEQVLNEVNDEVEKDL